MKEEGVWRTIRGRRIFIGKGESLGEAMSKSGKFKNLTRTKLRETKDQLRQEDRLNKSQKYWEKEQKATSKEKFNALRNKAERDYNKLRARDKDEIEYRGATQRPDHWIREKELQNENAKTRVDKNWNRYSEADKRELRHEELQKKLADYKEKTASPIPDLNLKIYEHVKNNIRAEKERKYQDKQKEKSRKAIEDYKAKKQSNNKITNPEAKEKIRQVKKDWEDSINQIEDYYKKRNEFDQEKKQSNNTDPYNDPESNESQRLQDIQSRYDEYLQDTEGRGASYGEIAYVDSLRGKDLDDFEKELDDYETKKYNKQEKATKKTKKDKNDWLPKATEIKEQGKSNRKEVSDNIQAHILSYYDKPEDFIHQMDVMKQPTNWHNGMQLAKGGSYLIYYDDQRKFLDDLKINPSNKKFNDDRVFETYSQLIGRESAKLYDKIKKHQTETINNYKKRKGK